MKYFLLLACVVGLLPAAQAQSANPSVWCPPGATWTYGWTWWNEHGTVTVRYARDTIVAGQPAQLLTRRQLVYSRIAPTLPPLIMPMSSVLTRTVASRVEVQANGQFYTLYDFAARPGASWLTPSVVPIGPCPTELVQVIVDSVGTQLLAGHTLRWLRVHLAAPAGTSGNVLGRWTGRLYEQLGGMEYLQPQSLTCGGTDPGYIGGFTGFQATGWPAISATGGSLVLATSPARALAAGFSSYPNPSTGVLRLVLPTGLAPDARLQLLDLAGQVVRRLAVPANGQLDIRGLPAGTYVLLLLGGRQQSVLAQRLVVE